MTTRDAAQVLVACWGGVVLDQLRTWRLENENGAGPTSSPAPLCAAAAYGRGRNESGPCVTRAHGQREG